MLEDIPDAEDKVCKYDFDHINKWMPLVYYDQIKARNTVETEESTNNSLPFFLDFHPSQAIPGSPQEWNRPTSHAYGLFFKTKETE